MAELIPEEGHTMALFTMWNMNGGPVPISAVNKVEKFIKQVAEDYEKHEGVRLLTQTTRVDGDDE